MSKPDAFSLHLECIHWLLSYFASFVSMTDLIALVDFEARIFKNCPEVLACRLMRNIANENLDRLPDDNCLTKGYGMHLPE